MRETLTTPDALKSEMNWTVGIHMPLKEINDGCDWLLYF